jgi:hypothetical protein
VTPGNHLEGGDLRPGLDAPVKAGSLAGP